MSNGAMPAGAWAGREHDEPDGGAAVRLGLAKLVADGPPRDGPVLGLDDDPQVRAAGERVVDRQDEVALLALHDVAGLAARPVDEVAAAAGELAEHRLEDVLEVAALGGRLGPLRGTRRGRRLDRREPLVELREAAR